MTLDPTPVPNDGTHSEQKNNPNGATNDRAQPDAFGTVPPLPPVRDRVRDGLRPPVRDVPNLVLTPTNTRLTPRDTLLLRYLVCFRLLTYGQLQRLVFPNADPSFARRRIRTLCTQGWLMTWELPTRVGGHDRYALPTAIAIRHVLGGISRGDAWAPLLERMLPRTKRMPLQLKSGKAPKWLAHQREVNHLVASIVTSPARKVLWASSWDAPFPSQFGMFTAPQPDYVLVQEDDSGEPQLVFGEHDRGSEPVDRFVARKVALYAALAAFPDACAHNFGVRTFRVQVSVVDPILGAPVARLRALLDAVRAHGGPDIFRFTVGGWCFAYPDSPIWFSPANAPMKGSVAVRDHANVIL